MEPLYCGHLGDLAYIHLLGMYAITVNLLVVIQEQWNPSIVDTGDLAYIHLLGMYAITVNLLVVIQEQGNPSIVDTGGLAYIHPLGIMQSLLIC